MAFSLARSDRLGHRGLNSNSSVWSVQKKKEKENGFKSWKQTRRYSLCPNEAFDRLIGAVDVAFSFFFLMFS